MPALGCQGLWLYYTTLNAPGAGSGHSQGTFTDGINSQGDIVGYITNSKGVYHGFLLHQGRYTTIDDPRAGSRSRQGTQAFGINPQGDIVGTYTDNKVVSHGFLLHRG